jgi:hypothetical protein
MEKLIIRNPEAPVREVELPPGTYKVGRAPHADLQIDHPSVSSSHCEMSVGDGALAVKDLGSTNGILLDGQPVQEAQVAPGQIMRMGEVEVQYGAPPSAKTGLRLAPVPVAETAPAPPPAALYVPRLTQPKPVRRPKNFYKSIPGAFIYPCKRQGWILLLSGTFIIGIFDCLLNFRVYGFLVAGQMLGGIASACITGYIFLYLQSIITTTAMGEDNVPPWPDYEGWWDSAVYPYLRLLAICAACLAPALLCLRYAGDMGFELFIPLLILGFLYAPMAFLAVAMDDSLLGLNPLLVIPSILRVPLEYIASCLLLGTLLGALGGLIALIQYLLMLYFFQQYNKPGLPIGVIRPPAFQPESIVTQILGLFLVLYFMMVVMRVLGLLYYTQRDRLGWRV